MKNEFKRLKKKYKILLPALNERDRRLSAAADAMTLGFVLPWCIKQPGIARPTISTGIHELKTQPRATDMGRVRRTGGGRKQLSARQKDLLKTMKKK